MKSPLAKGSGSVHTLLDRWWRTISERIQTLRFQLMGIVIISVLVPAFLGGWFASDRIGDILREQVHAEIGNRTIDTARQVSDNFNRLEQDVRAFSSSFLLNEEVRNVQTGKDKNTLEKSLNNIDRYLAYLLEDTDNFSGFAIINPDETLLAFQFREGETIPTGTVPEMQGSQPVFVEINGSSVPRIMILQRMSYGGGLSSTIFAAIVKGEELQSTVNGLAMPDTALYLLDGNGRIKAANIRIASDGRAPAGVLSLINGRESQAVYVGLLGQKVIATWSNISELPWSVVLETSYDKAMKPLFKFRAQVFLMALILAALFLVPALLFARTIVLPLEELSRVSRQIKSGKPGLEVKARAGGELGEFIQTFNSMSISLQESLEEIQAYSEQMRVMTITDPLTGRYNRRYIEDYLPRELELSIRTGQPLSVLMIDLDKFKNYNDTYGHIAGDEALKQMADLLVSNVRKTDVVARFGGEEWIVCLSHTDGEGGARIAEKLRYMTEKNIFMLKGKETRITISIGLATAPGDGSTFEEIVEAADAAMYIAKDAGRNRVELFTGPVPGGSSPPGPMNSSPGSTPPSSPDPSQSRPGKGSQGAGKSRKETPSRRRS